MDSCKEEDGPRQIIVKRVSHLGIGKEKARQKDKALL